MSIQDEILANPTASDAELAKRCGVSVAYVPVARNRLRNKNLLPPLPKDGPRPGSILHRVQLHDRGHPDRTHAEAALALGLDPAQVRSARGNLRRKGWA